MTGELVCLVQFDRIFVGEEPGAQGRISSNIPSVKSVQELICWGGDWGRLIDGILKNTRLLIDLFLFTESFFDSEESLTSIFP
jgi:hypothetical protein